ncbi:MAG TPA: alpha-L-rhamnosidase N-terminal domain-containing protein, partial [Verrucomicrobiae bacterium]
MTRLFIFAFVAFASLAQAGLQPMDLRCDYAVNPVNVDSTTPRLFWQLSGTSQRQSAYEILAASSPALLAHDQGDLWSSGKVLSDATIQISYIGQKLTSFQTIYWKVRVWDEIGQVSRWSPPATWTMGVLSPSDWHAQWITSGETNVQSSLFRHVFTPRAPIRSAFINICGLGQYDLSINHKQITTNYLSPGWTKYDHTCLYDTYDVTDQLGSGPNVIGVELGNGMYNVPGAGRFTKFKGSFGPLKLIAQLRLEYGDGSVEFIGTDNQWQTAPGSIVYNTIYGGEDEDARRRPMGWEDPGFNATHWATATETISPGGELRGLSCAAPPIEFMETHPG